MLALTVAGILIMLLTLLMFAVEQWERMRDRGRVTRRAERVEALEEIRLREWARIEADAVEDLRMDLDMYDSHGFTFLDDQQGREEG